MIKDTIKSLRETIGQSNTGHLPLSCRVGLMKQIGNVLTVQKIQCECCKKACSFIGMQNPDNVRLLTKINDHLYGNREIAEDILVETDKLRLYVENNPGMDTLVSWATVMLGYDVHYGGTSMLETEDYHGEDDDDFDPECWEPDFIVSLICSADSSGAEDDKYDPEKRREYWNWYLDMVLSVYEKPQQEVIPFNHDTIHIPVPHGCDPALSDKIDRLNSALASYIHAPTNRKETDRMNPYAEDPALVRIVADVVFLHTCHS